MPRLSIETRAQIVALLEQGHSVKDIAASYHLHSSTIYRLQNRYIQHGTVHDLPRSGRPPILMEKHQRKIVRDIICNKHSNASQLQWSLSQHENVQISACTICRVLRKNGLVSRIKKKKPFLKKIHQQRRLAFAKNTKNGQLMIGQELSGPTKVNSIFLDLMAKSIIGRSQETHCENLMSSQP